MDSEPACLPGTVVKCWLLAEQKEGLDWLLNQATIRLGDKTRAFPKNARLLTQRDFNRVFDKAERSSDRYFVVLGRSNLRSSARLGLAISRKCALRAVDRNRIKRFVREVFRESRSELGNIDFVVICRPGVLGSTRNILNRSLSRHFEKVRLRLCGSL